ncbi:DUF1127 domain-containing protein [Inquilinus sp.]|uniref:DUF1127 domain-containing protein n=1 Tax=Inquilinus sp. TaxID=1932117 RepID=UPI0031D109CB
MDSATAVPCREPRAIRPAPPVLGRLAAWIRRQVKMSRDTARLMALDDHLLADMGLTRGEIRGLVRHNRLPAGWTGR